MSGVVRGPASCLWDRSRQGSPHDDGVPNFSISTPVVLMLAPLLHETGSAVELEGGRIVRPYLEGHFVSSRSGRPPDGSVEHRRPNAQTSPPDDDEHPDVSDPVGGDFNRNMADDSRTSHRGGIRNQYGRRNPRRESVEQATAGIAIERNLNADPAALCGDGPRLFDQLVEILGACRSDDCRLGNATTCGSHRLSLPRPRRHAPLAMRQMEPETPAPSTARPERPSPLFTTGADIGSWRGRTRAIV